MTLQHNKDRFRLHRAGVLNVWQYDEQVFECAGGRLLLRGANGAGKSKTLEMLLPFTLDGDKARLTASNRHHTSLLWLMLDGYDGASRTGYLWVEFARPDGAGTLTCGIGVRASKAARQATAWYFTSPRRVGVDLLLEDDAGPLSQERCRAEVETDGHFFDSPRRYKDHVGQTLFGLPPARYDELLRLLYWLRQPQVGEEIEPARLAAQLVQALPQVDDAAVRTAGDTFDALEKFGEEIDRRDKAATAVAAFGQTYAGYAASVVRSRAEALVAADRERRRRGTQVSRSGAAAEQAQAIRDQVSADLTTTTRDVEAAKAQQYQLQQSPEARSERRLLDLHQRAADLATAATEAQRATDAVRDRAQRSRAQLDDDRDRVVADVSRSHADLLELSTQLLGLGWQRPMPVPNPLQAPLVDDAESAELLVDLLGQARAGLDASRAELGELQAAVTVVDSACREHAAAAGRVAEHERRESEAEQRVERTRAAAEQAQGRADELGLALTSALQQWREHPAAIDFELPDLTAAGVAQIAAAAREAAAPSLAHWQDESGAATADRTAAQRTSADLARQRADVQAQRDPSPPAPVWPRSRRDGEPGAPLWRLVDFAADVSDEQRAAVESALEASGLLDAWVLPDGTALAADRTDVLLTPGPAVEGPSLRQVLVPEPGSPVSAAVVAGVLDRIGWGEHPAAAAALTADGRWWLGPLHGRSTKPQAQYVGASARTAERARRLAELDTRIADTQQDESRAATRLAAATVALQGVERWLTSIPRHEPLLEAWTTARLATDAAAVERGAHAALVGATSAVRRLAADLWTGLEQLGQQHGLPVDKQGLAARRERLREAGTRIDRQVGGLPQTVNRLQQWQRDWLRWSDEDDEALSRERDAEKAQGRAIEAAGDAAALQATVGASVLELQRHLEQAREQIVVGTEQVQTLGLARDIAIGEVVSTQNWHEQAKARLAESHLSEQAARVGLSALTDVGGLLDAALGMAASGEQLTAIGQGELVIATELADLPANATDENAVLAAAQALQAGPAASVEPSVRTVEGILVAVGRDEGGERPLVELGRRLRSAVDDDRSLLTDRERALFEDHVLGQLGESLRQRRLEATELVKAMNDQLESVTTSQGISVRLRWRQRDDIPGDAARAVELLGQPVSALLPSERRELRDALHRLIEVSRAESPELSYTEHLARALDYRQWFAFTIRYRRPEVPDTWLDLHRRSALSQGEQKVLCYLPLFAAAAAHFSSLAGAAPDAPRLVLLDDAFPKIDVRTHPLLFGLLVDLDLDFVITSERLWGDHATVPSLSIYEALRDPLQRGIAQYHHRWDGQRLEALGA